ncbi:MAG: AraC family transcriptional regulator [Clostridiales bacterium]|nr:AraC family transcriptional regulator [Clostridiales bacterium]
MQEKENAYENVSLQPDIGFDIRFVTMKHNSPFHWHRELEILYILNGHATITMDGERHELNALDLIVMDFSKIHEVIYALPQTMGVCIHISRSLLRRYLPDTELLGIHCHSKLLSEEKQEAYDRLCASLKDLTVLYVNQKATYELRSTALILGILAELAEHFAEPLTKASVDAGVGNMERLEQICDYVEHHYKEEISLKAAADELGLSREYFCRFFKQNTGTSFLRYVNQVRLDHIYQELLYTDESVQNIMERHGFYNQKLFYRMFRERYGCTPTEMRRMTRNHPYV